MDESVDLLFESSVIDERGLVELAVVVEAGDGVALLIAGLEMLPYLLRSGSSCGGGSLIVRDTWHRLKLEGDDRIDGLHDQPERLHLSLARGFLLGSGVVERSVRSVEHGPEQA